MAARKQSTNSNKTKPSVKVQAEGKKTYTYKPGAELIKAIK